MKTFYCVQAEFYDSCQVKACIVEKQSVKKPNNLLRRIYGMTAFKIWLVDKNHAIELNQMIQEGDVHIDDLISFYNDYLPLEGRAA